MLARHLVSCYELAPQFSLEEGKRVESATLTLASAAMASGELLPDSAAKAPMREVLTYQIKRYIRENLNSNDVAPAKIAQKFGISRTQLYQLLEPLGGIARYQRQLRLQRCFVDLQNSAKADLQISEIAYRWGFNHLATFNRSFRKHFDCTPGEVRAAGLSGGSSISMASNVNAQRSSTEREHHQWFQLIGA